MQVGATATTAGAAGTAAMTRVAREVMGKQDFLRLLLTQLQYQDPINPVKNEEFAAQLAQFSSLEQMQNLNDAMNTLISLQVSTALLSQAGALLGREVAVYDPERGGDAVGIVREVMVRDGLPYLRILVNGQLEEHPVLNVTEIHLGEGA